MSFNNITQVRILMYHEVYGLIPRLRYSEDYEIYHDEVRVLKEIASNINKELYSNEEVTKEVIIYLFELIYELNKKNDPDLKKIADDLLYTITYNKTGNH